MIAGSPYLDALDRITEPDWPAGIRRAALERFLAAGLPTPRQEEWKYTSLEHLEHAGLHAATSGEASEAVCPDAAAYPGHVLTFLDGQLACHGTYLHEQLAGSLHHLADTHAVRQHLGHVAGDSALAVLNRALWRDGARVLVPAGEHVAMPIFSIFSAGEADAMLYPRTLAVLESGAEAVLVEHFLGQTDSAYWQNAVGEIVLEEGARLTHIKVLEDGPAATHTGLTAVRLGRDSTYRALYIGLGGALTRHDLTARLEAEGATIRVDAFNLADARRHTDLHLRIEHLAPNTRSRITYRGLADARGRAVFDGRVIVQRGAQGTDAGQTCRNLLLSPHAEVDAKPQLEIYADAVKCSHGVTVGQLDEDALFYLLSRGLDRPTARQLLLQAFAGEALGLLDEVRLRDWVMPKVLAALSRTEAGR